MKALALWAIRAYQRFLSPRKGFHCAYRAYTGHPSCSALGYRAIRRFGVVDGIVVLQSRLHKCSVACRRYRPPVPKQVLASQAGFIDCECGPSPCEWDLPCDCCGSKKEKKNKRDRDVVLPPRRNS